jgi:hypothetical protein
MNMLILLVREAVIAIPIRRGLSRLRYYKKLYLSLLCLFICVISINEVTRNLITSNSRFLSEVISAGLSAYLSVSFCRTSKINLSCYIHLFKFAVDLIAGYIYKILLLAVLTYQINILE